MWGGEAARLTSVVRADARTGRLVRSVVVVSKPVAEKRVEETVVPAQVVPSAQQTAKAEDAASAVFPDVVAKIAAQQSLPPELIDSVIKVESNYNPYAVSPKGALGLMQLIPATARRFGVADVFNPVENIQGGARYLKYLLGIYGGDYPLALAAYNAGEGAVAKYGSVPPYKETETYVKRVAQHIQQAQKAAPPAKVKAAKPNPPPEGGGDGVRHVQEIVQADGTVRYVSQ
jgi:soluble lytic murein transglycosylase-like protein